MSVTSLELQGGSIRQKYATYENSCILGQSVVNPINVVDPLALFKASTPVQFKLSKQTLSGHTLSKIALTFTVTNGSAASITLTPATILIDQVQLAFGSPGASKINYSGFGLHMHQLMFLNTQSDTVLAASLIGIDPLTFASTNTLAAGATKTYIVSLNACLPAQSDMPIQVLNQELFLNVAFRYVNNCQVGTVTNLVTLSNVNLLCDTYVYNERIVDQLMKEFSIYPFQGVGLSETFSTIDQPNATIGQLSNASLTQTSLALSHAIIVPSSVPETATSWMGVPLLSFDHLNPQGLSYGSNNQRSSDYVLKYQTAFLTDSQVTNTMFWYLDVFNPAVKDAAIDGKFLGSLYLPPNSTIQWIPANTGHQELIVLLFSYISVKLYPNGTWEVSTDPTKA